MSTPQHHQVPDSKPHSESQSESQSHPDPDSETNPPKKPVLALPDSTNADAPTTLDLSDGGSTVKLDHLGPLVVNQDGSLSRISNWAQMTEVERRNTLRVLGKRNKARLEALRGGNGGET